VDNFRQGLFVPIFFEENTQNVVKCYNVTLFEQTELLLTRVITYRALQGPEFMFKCSSLSA